MTDPDHGTITRYKAGCRCTPCRSTNALRVQRQRQALRLRVLVDAAPGRAYLLRLKADFGIGAWRAAELAGLSKMLVGKVRAGRLLRITRDTLQKILAIPPAPALGTLVPAAETQRRLRTLIAEHFERRELARRLGYKSRLKFQKGEGAKVTLRSALKVRRLYRLLEGAQDPPAPAGRSSSTVDDEDRVRASA